MRKEVLEGVLRHIMTDIQPNYVALAKQYNGDYRTVKRYYESGMKGDTNKLRERKIFVSFLLCKLEEIIRDKGAIQLLDSIVVIFREETVQKATIRMETPLWLSAQADWK
ncbi:TPA: hypothetical protein ACSZA9_14395 [Listeria monocytogenes]|nr:hypothetical protein [Listeria monocytogenes]EAH3957140.1 hypothetical protein [Listeria monocytogenes]EKA2552502.1 hypothetical protein [Listeria monocytogenes]EKA2555636.1 hypothetical protein [Listeria monocytogenes]EKA2558780.1 hypothetical protein [Listeria monocytogenes]